MSRQKKEFKALNCKLETTIWDALDEHCKDTGTNKTFVVEKAVEQYLQNYQKQQDMLKQFNDK